MTTIAIRDLVINVDIDEDPDPYMLLEDLKNDEYLNNEKRNRLVESYGNSWCYIWMQVSTKVLGKEYSASLGGIDYHFRDKDSKDYVRYHTRELIQELVSDINTDLELMQKYNGITQSEFDKVKLESYTLKEISKQESIIFTDLVEPKIRI